MEELKVTVSVRVHPIDNTCDGEDRSPMVGLGGVSTSTSRSLAILVVDPDSPGGGGFVHWIMWNINPAAIIPETIPKTPEVNFPIQAVQGKNSFGRIGYSGPCPPRGQTHRYFFRVYGLDTMLDLPGGSTSNQLVKAMKGHIVQYGETFVTSGR